MKTIRTHAVSRSLICAPTLADAIARLGFVQADPIRSPARAQDLILRHRVTSYKAGDLDLHYPSLNIEEDYFGNYGFLSRDVWRLLHPRSAAPLSKVDRKVMDAVKGLGPVHPKDLEATLGKARVVNAWGGFSHATKQSLERLHFQGILRVARREKGIRVYEAIPPVAVECSPTERLERLLMVIAEQLAPVPEKTLSGIGAILRRRMAKAPEQRKVMRSLVDTGRLERQVFEGIAYLWPSVLDRFEPHAGVRFLAPFDPIVWDRARFQHLWGWEYRFEAYVPPAKRIRGYYALPLLWLDEVVGWVNASVSTQRKLELEFGFVNRKPTSRMFRQELDAEVARFEEFLDLGRKVD